MENYCQRVLDKALEVKLRAESLRDLITSYRDKTRPFDSREFKEMVEEAYNFLSLHAVSAPEKDDYNFDKIPDALP